MKVKELIEKLKEFDGELEVWVETNRENTDFLINLGEDYKEQWTRLKKLESKQMTDNRMIFVIA